MEARVPERMLGKTGWALFAGILFLILGGFNVIEGVLAFSEDGHLVADAVFFGDLTLWGWIILLIGVAQLLTAYLIISGAPSGRAAGVGLATLSIFAHLFFIPVFPIWSVIIMGANGLVIYGLTVEAPSVAR